MSGDAGSALVAAALERLGCVSGVTGAYESAPLQAAVPYIEVEAGLETDWSHKSGSGRELRLAVTVRDKGEKPERLRRIAAQAGNALRTLTVPGWQLVTLQLLRSRTAGTGQSVWAGTIEYRARMLELG